MTTTTAWASFSAQPTLSKSFCVNSNERCEKVKKEKITVEERHDRFTPVHVKEEDKKEHEGKSLCIYCEKCVPFRKGFYSAREGFRSLSQMKSRCVVGDRKSIREWLALILVKSQTRSHVSCRVCLCRLRCYPAKNGKSMLVFIMEICF